MSEHMQEWDSQTYENVRRMHWKRAVEFCHGNLADAEDLFGDALLLVVRTGKPVDDQRHMFATVLRNRAIDLARRGKRERRAIERLGAAAMASSASDDIESWHERQHAKDVSEVILHACTEVDRNLLDLRGHGLSNAEIGDRLGLTPSAVNGRSHRARARTRARLDDDTDNPEPGRAHQRRAFAPARSFSSTRTERPLSLPRYETPIGDSHRR